MYVINCWAGSEDKREISACNGQASLHDLHSHSGSTNVFYGIVQCYNTLGLDHPPVSQTELSRKKPRLSFIVCSTSSGMWCCPPFATRTRRCGKHCYENSLRLPSLSWNNAITPLQGDIRTLAPSLASPTSCFRGN